MMNLRTRIAITGLTGLAVSGLLLSGPAVSQSAKGLVALQPGTPGTAQVGHANLTGTIRAGRMTATSTSSDAVVGSTSAGFGVSGIHSTSNAMGALGGVGTGVYGSQASASYAGYFDGAVAINGATTISTGFSPALRVLGHTRLMPSSGLPLLATTASVNALVGRTTSNDEYPAVVGSVDGGTASNAAVWGSNILSDTHGFLAYGQAGVKGTGLWGGYFEGMGFFSGNVGIGVSGPGAGLHVITSGQPGVLSQSTDQAAVFAVASQADGVVGLASQAIVSGVFGSTSNGAGYGVFSGGTLGSSGTKSFVIDHPLDPENKMLKHYCTEGPEPLNVYRGTVTTNSEGFATVTLPDYFDEINIDPTYQLTVIGGSGFPQAKIAQKIVKREFVVQTSEPDVEVCWRIEARRNDRFVREYGAPVEVDKGTKRGKYLSPELYGQPAAKALHPTEPPKARHIPPPVFAKPKVASK